MASLYREGWRQGTILEAVLPLDTVGLSAAGSPERHQRDHGLWVVVTQDCDLDRVGADEAIEVIELRPVFAEDPPDNYGLRSEKLLIGDDEYLESASARTMVSPQLLTGVVATGSGRRDIADGRAHALKTWLGLRYDRPAVPDELVVLAKRIAEEVGKKRRREVGRRVRDVLMQFEQRDGDVFFSLFAIIEHEDDENQVREWLAEIAKAVPTQLGIADEIEAAPATLISLHVIETSYAADVSSLTWRPSNPDPQGAH
jgi:hypothetical protein